MRVIFIKVILFWGGGVRGRNKLGLETSLFLNRKERRHGSKFMGPHHSFKNPYHHEVYLYKRPENTNVLLLRTDFPPKHITPVPSSRPDFPPAITWSVLPTSCLLTFPRDSHPTKCRVKLRKRNPPGHQSVYS